MTTLKIFRKRIRFLLDTGSTVNLIDGKTYSSIRKHIKLYECSNRIYSFAGSSPLQLKGKVYVNIRNKGIERKLQFFVTKDYNSGCILGYQACMDLKFIDIVSKLDEKSLDQYKGVFNGIGKYKYEKIKLHINDQV